MDSKKGLVFIAVATVIFSAFSTVATGLAQPPSLPGGLEEKDSASPGGPALPPGLGEDSAGQSPPSQPGLPPGLNGGDKTASEEPASPAEAAEGWTLPDDLEGYAELRGGTRLKDDPVQDDVSLAEARLQISYDKYVPELLPRGSFRFTGDVHAMPEGSVFFASEPLVRVEAPLPEAQLIESRLMNILHFQSLIATKAARCVQAADGRAVVDFGLRRAHGAEAGLWAARAAYIGGFAATATCLANALYGVPVTGTMAHSFVLAHDDERTAFRRFAHSHPDNVVLLIDTYDTEAAAHQVVELARELEADGIGVKAVRLDSGDLGRHAALVRQILDQGGQQDVRILASGGLDEFGIRELVERGAPIDGFGVGSKVDTSADLPFLDSAYKLHAYGGEPRRKRSEGKADLPGAKQVYRSWDGQGRLSRDVIGLADEHCEGQPLLQQVVADGAPLAAPEPLDVLRERCAQSLASLPERWSALDGAESSPVVLSDGLQELRRRMDETA